MQDGRLISGSRDESIKIWNITDTTTRSSTLIGHTEAISSVITLPNGDIASGVWDGRIIIWDGVNYNIKQDILVNELVLLPNGFLANAGRYSNVIIVDPYNGKIEQVLVGHTQTLISVTVLLNGYVVSGSNYCTIKIWNL